MAHRQLARAEDGRRRHQRRGRRRAHRGRGAATRLVERYGLRDLPRVGRADVRPRRGGRAQLLRADPRRPLRRRTGRWTTTASPSDPVPFEVALEVDGLDRPRRLLAPRPTRRRARSTARSRRTVSASRIAITMLAGGGEAPNEGHFRAARGGRRGPARCSIRSRPRRASSTAGRRCRRSRSIYKAVAEALPEARARLQRRRHLLRSSGGACARRPASLGRRLAAPDRPGRLDAGGDGANSLIHLAESATRFSPTEVWEAEEPLAARARRARARLRCGPGKHRGGLGVDFSFHDARGLLTSPRRSSGRRRRRGGSRAAARRGRTAWRSGMPDGSRTTFGKATRRALPKGRRFERARGGGGGYGPPAERDPKPFSPTCARATSPRSTPGALSARVRRGRALRWRTPPSTRPSTTSTSRYSMTGRRDSPASSRSTRPRSARRWAGRACTATPGSRRRRPMRSASRAP